MPTRLRRYDEPGHMHFWTISCYHRLSFFWNDRIKQAPIAGLGHIRETHRICLIGYVIMPEHVHVLLYPQARGSDEPIPISTLLHDFKEFVGREGKRRLREYWRRHARLWSAPLNHWAQGEMGDQPFWNKRGHDFNVYRFRKLQEKLDYCHRNSITRGLVDRPAQWRWSSYRYYEFDDRSVLAMYWDGQWPIIW
jgi:putative transposase